MADKLEQPRNNPIDDARTKRDRHSIAVPTPAKPPLTEIQRANQEALNTLRQYDRMIELIKAHLNSTEPFRLRPSVIQELNRISIDQIENDAGRWRDVEMLIGDSEHVPPPVAEIPHYVDELCDYVNDHWNDRSPLHLSAYIMWRLNWIHPFVDGNGRTTRALSYYVLCCKLRFYLPGVTTIPELIASDKPPYYEALEEADEAFKQGVIDVSKMELLLRNLLARQMVEALESAGQVFDSNVFETWRQPEPQTKPTHGKPIRAPYDISPILSGTFGAVGLLFFMGLVLFGVQIPIESRWLVVIVFSLVCGLASGFLGGTADVRGSIPLSKVIQGVKVRFSVTGGLGVMILVLILGKFLFI